MLCSIPLHYPGDDSSQYKVRNSSSKRNYFSVNFMRRSPAKTLKRKLKTEIFSRSMKSRGKLEKSRVEYESKHENGVFKLFHCYMSEYFRVWGKGNVSTAGLPF